MGVIDLLYYFFYEIMKKLTSLQFLISRIQKKKISSTLGEKLMQKQQEKISNTNGTISTLKSVIVSLMRR